MPESADHEPQPITAHRDVRACAAAGLLALAIDNDEELEEELPSLVYQPGAMIGRYRLVKLLGEGGFGIVWLAEQREPIRREVALKIIRPGMDTRTVIARFRAEQKALERMDHPCIAAVLDAGATEQGRPYFVMELVRGRPITHYCEEHGLDLSQRLALFIDVCHAVQHAHQKAVMHRDLKPSNILVEERDGRPVPKVIDFGIAKALTDEFDGLGSLAYTAHGIVLGTPQYMAPEQAVLGGLTMDIRVDVYSLGAILYEMLTGSPPMILERGSRTSVDQVLKRIHDEEAEPPSHRAQQNVSAPLLATQLKGDLDWIILKALEKDPERRYPTASVLADEVGRFLHHEPVLAGPPDAWYRMQKWVRRNRSAFISGTVIVFSLVIATAFSVYAFLREAKARIEAERLERHAEASERLAVNESQKALGMVNFLAKLLDQAGSLVDQGKNPEALRLALDQSVKSLDDLQSQPELQGQLCERLALVYAAMGDQRRALPLRYRQVECLKTLYGPADSRTLKAQLDCVYGESDANNKARALELCGEVVQQWEASGKHGTGGWFDAVCQHAIQLARGGKPKEGLVEMLRLQDYRNSHGVPALEDMGFLRRLAEIQGQVKDFSGATSTLQRCLQQFPPNAEARNLRGRQSTLISLARLKAEEMKPEEAARDFEESIRSTIKMSGSEYHPLIEIWIETARQYVASKRFADAFRCTDAALHIARANGTDEKLPHALRASAEIRNQGGKLEDSLAFRRECVDAERGLRPTGVLWIDDHKEVVRLLSRLGRHDEAEKLAPVLWQETQYSPAAWSDDGLVKNVCKTLIDVCGKWQEVNHSTAHQKDIETWSAKLDELKAKENRQAHR